MNANEIFNYNSVKTKMDELQIIFDNFAKDLNDLNIQIETKVDQNAMSAIYGDAGAAIKKTWDENSASFSSFKANFEKWSQLVSTVSLNNLTFEANAYRTIRGEDKITSSELLDGMGYTTVEIPSANGEEIFKVEQIDPYGDLSTLTGAKVATNTSSVLENYEAVKAGSLIQTGEPMALTSGSKLKIDGYEYIVYGFKNSNGEMGMWLTRDGFNNVWYLPANSSESPKVTNLVPSQLKQSDYFTHLVTLNPGWCVTAIAAPNDASYYEAVISNNYITVMCTQMSSVVFNTGSLANHVKNNKSFVMADGYRVLETDYINTSINQGVYYNPYFDYMDGNNAKETDGQSYWTDVNYDGFVTHKETLDKISGGHNVHRAFEKARDRGNNGKYDFDGSGVFLKVEKK